MSSVAVPPPLKATTTFEVMQLIAILLPRCSHCVVANGRRLQMAQALYQA